MALSLTHIHLRVESPEETAAWFADHLGGKLIERYETAAGGPAVGIDMAGTRVNIMGIPPGQSLLPATSDPHMGVEHFGFETDDLEGLVGQLKSKGVQVLEPIRPGRNGTLCYIEAPGNLRIELQQYASK